MYPKKYRKSSHRGPVEAKHPKTDTKTAFLTPTRYDEHSILFTLYGSTPKFSASCEKLVYTPSIRSDFQTEAVRITANYSLTVFFLPSQKKP